MPLLCASPVGAAFEFVPLPIAGLPLVLVELTDEAEPEGRLFVPTIALAAVTPAPALELPEACAGAPDPFGAAVIVSAGVGAFRAAPPVAPAADPPPADTNDATG